jgi:AMMECR1 domain-containing protein
MATGPTTMTRPHDLSDADRDLLLDLAEVSVRSCLRGTRYPGPDLARLSARLLEPCGAFVVVRIGDDVFGCAGQLTGGPVGSCIPELARQAAFDAHTGRSITDDDLSAVSLEVSLLESRRAVPATSRAELLHHLDPPTCGLAITAGEHHAVLLAGVWELRPDADDFLDTAMRRAGLRPNRRWPDSMTAELITTTDFARSLA